MNFIADHEKEIALLIEHCYKVTGALKGVRITDERLKYIEPLGKKIFNHIVTAYSLYGGTTINFSDNTKTTFVDFASMIVLSRAAFESYLTLNYIYIHPKNEEEKLFRFLSWDLAGFIEREKYDAVDEDSKKIKEHEQVLKRKCIERLCENPFYKSLPEQIQQKIIKGKWRGIKSWADLASEASIFTDNFKTYYSLISGYSHSGRASIMQIHQTKNEKEFSQVFQLINLILISRFMVDYSELFPICDKVFKSNLTAYNLAIIWSQVCK